MKHVFHFLSNTFLPELTRSVDGHLRLPTIIEEQGQAQALNEVAGDVDPD